MSRTSRRIGKLVGEATRVIALLVLAAVSGPQTFGQATAELRALVERVAPSVVIISGAAKPGDQRSAGGTPVPSGGTGLVLSADGYVASAAHIVNHLDKIKVTVAGGTTLPAQVIATDEPSNVALLKVAPIFSLTPAKFANSDQMKRGEPVLAVGDPMSPHSSLWLGRVSALNAELGVEPFNDYVQVDPAFDSRYAGGPLFSPSGEVVGMAFPVVSAAAGAPEVAVALPSNVLADVVEQLRHAGVVERGWIGVQVQSLSDDHARTLGLAQAAGALLAIVSEGGPAASAGLRAGDVVVSLNGREVANARSFARAIAEQAAGSEVVLGIARPGESVESRLRVGRLSAGVPAPMTTPAPIAGTAAQVPSAAERQASPKPAAAPATDCDRLAADPDDPAHVGDGVPDHEIRAYEAATACEAALALYPGEERFAYQLARALLKFAPERASATFRELAERGHAGATHGIGEGYFLEGREAEAAVWFRRAAEKGHVPAMSRLRSIYAAGRGVAKDAAEADRWSRQFLARARPAAEAGDTRAMWSLVGAYERGEGVAQDPAEAAQWWQKAVDTLRQSAEKGDIIAMRRLASMYWPGGDVVALRLLRRAAESGDVIAMEQLALNYSIGMGGLPKDETESARWRRRAAETGDAGAMKDFADVLAWGFAGVPEDKTEAARWYRLAAEKGVPDAMVRLGDLYSYGRGVVKDEAEGARWYVRAAELGTAGP